MTSGAGDKHNRGTELFGIHIVFIFCLIGVNAFVTVVCSVYIIVIVQNYINVFKF